MKLLSMDWPSGFFVAPNELEHDRACVLEPLAQSGGGAFRLYRGNAGGRLVVYKAIVPEHRGNILYEDLLKKEFEIGNPLDHPNIRRYLDYVHVAELGNAIEMEWVEGKPLDEAEIPDRKTAIKLLCELCDALKYIHDRQIVHRDLKPSNILVTNNGGNVKLIDFGFSDSDCWSLLKTPAGTVSYASPEQLAGGDLDCRSDIYSLGLVIREILPRNHGVAARCLRADRDRRFADAAEVRAALMGKRIAPVLIPVAVLCLAAAAMIFLPRQEVKPFDTFDTPAIAVDTSIASIEDVIEEATRIMLDADEGAREP